MHQPRIELGAQQASVAQDGAATWECWILPLNHWCTPYLLRKNINTYILVAFAVVYYYEE